MRTQAAASRQATMPRLALNRKDTREGTMPGRLAERAPIPPVGPDLPGNAFTVAVSWPVSGRSRNAGSRNRGRPATQPVTRALHGLVIGSATALRRNPGNVAIGILHVTGFAVNAVLGVDHEFGTRRLIHPFIDARRAITIRRSGIDVVLRGLLQIHVRDLQM